MPVSKKPYRNYKKIKNAPIEEPNTTVNPDGTITLDLTEPATALGLGEAEKPSKAFYDNLVEEIPEEDAIKLAETVIENTEAAERSRTDWLRTIQLGLDLLGVKVEEKSTPFEGACSAQHPLLMESAVKFQSKASNELLPANGPAKTKIMGDVTIEKEQRGNRVKNFMNYQLTEEMTEFYPDSERLLLSVALIGSAFKKTYYNAHLERPCSEFVPGDQLIVLNSAPDLERADHYTHVIYKSDYQIEQDCADGFYTKPASGLGVPQTPKLTDVQKKSHELMGITVGLGEREKVYTLYEHHVMMHIPALDAKDNKEYKLASPYIITVDLGSRRVIGLRRGWKEGDAKRRKRKIFTHYGFVPSFNFYHFGFLHLLGNLQLTLTSCLRSLVDAGQFATLQGGFKLKGVRIVDDGQPVHPGQFKEIETAVMDINKAIMPLPFKEPSNVLLQMLQFIDVKGQKFADSTEQVIQDSSNYGPVGTTMALLEASTKFFSAIHKRLHASLKNELQIVAAINAEYLTPDHPYNVDNESMRITAEDFGPSVAVIPVSDPNISSSAHRMAKAQSLYEMALRTPEIHDMREVMKHVYVNMDYLNIDKILPTPEEAQQADPVTDLQMAVQGKPIKAFPGQDHTSHVMLKQAFLSDPMSGNNPLMQKVAIQVQANVQEHMMMQFIEQAQAMAQMSGQGAQNPEQATAMAAQQVVQMNIQKLQAQAAENQGKSVKDQATMLLAQAEMIDTQTAAKKVEYDAQLKATELALKGEELEIKREAIGAKSVDMDKKIAAEKDKLMATKGMDFMAEGMKQGFELKKEKALIEHEAAHAPKPAPKKT